MGFQKEEDKEVPEYSDYMLLVEVMEREGGNIWNNISGSTSMAGEENKSKDSVVAGNSMLVNPRPWWSMVPRKKRTPRILCTIEAVRESTPQRHMAPNMPIGHPPMPESMDTLIRGYWGTEVVLVLQKYLKKSDVGGGQSWLSIQIVNVFLTKKEREALHWNDRISVTLVQPCNDTCFMESRKWNLATSFSYVLTKTWNKVVKKSTERVEGGRGGATLGVSGHGKSEFRHG